MMPKFFLYSFCLALFLVISCFKTSNAGAAAGERELFAGESPYTSIRVFDTDHGYRVMTFGRYWQTVIDPKNPELLFYAYSRTALASLTMRSETPRELLLVGLGGGSMANYLERKLKSARIDIAEIDPMVVQLAEKHFSFKPGSFGVYKQDGRQYLRKNQKKYDLIILDAYKGDEVPFHLTTQEFLELVKSRLSPDGLLAMHLWEPRINRYFESQLATVHQVFPQSYLFFAGDGSYLIFAPASGALLDKKLLVERGKNLTQKMALSFDLGNLIERQYSRISPPAPGTDILTDDYAPVNQMRARK
jgi:spermidine synthase